MDKQTVFDSVMIIQLDVNIWSRWLLGMRFFKDVDNCLLLKQPLKVVRFQDITPASIKIIAIWDIAVCSLTEVVDVSEVRTSSIIGAMI
jgi:hypothetical protein